MKQAESETFAIAFPELGFVVGTLEKGALTRLELRDDLPVGVSSDSTLSQRAQQVRAALHDYLLGTQQKIYDALAFPIHYSGTPFQMAVWDYLRTIPAGTTVTYGQIATAIGRPKAVRAVGTAVGKNPLPILVPCHRVVAATGLGGFSGGLHRKRWLLVHEGVLT